MRLGPPPQLLLCLFGSMTCAFQGGQFTFTVEIWLPRTFPFQAPLVFVVPSSSQRLRQSALVDHAGRVLHSYLSYWHTRPNSTLIEMMNYLHQAFCQDPPVFLPAPGQQAPSQAPGLAPGQAPKSPSVSAENSTANLVQLRAHLKDKMHQRFRKLQQDISIETDRILAQNLLLSEGEHKITKGMTAMRQETSKVLDELGQAKARNESLRDQVLLLQAGGDVDVDKLVIPQGVVSKQYNCTQPPPPTHAR